MRNDRRTSKDGATIRRLLVAAADEFARRGFAAARIRDIVDAAGANLSAVNYHFGGKQGLYEATLAMLRRRAHDDLPANSPQGRILAPEERLQAFARIMLLRYLGGDQPSVINRIVAHELLDPTPAIQAILQDTSGPQWARLREIVAEMLGPNATSRDVELHSLSTAGQWHSFLFGRSLLEHQLPDSARDPGLVDLLAEHITAFSIAAIRARRLQLDGAGAKSASADALAPRTGCAPATRTTRRERLR